MKADRNIQVLTAGLRAAHRQLFRHDELKKKEEYVHDFLTIYSDLEDALYSLYSAIQQGQTDKMNRDAGNVIVMASMIAEMTDESVKIKKGGSTP